MNTQHTNNPVQINALITHKQGSLYTVNLETLPCNKDPQNCCGGYCGSMLWKKVFPSAHNANKITIRCKQDFPIGSHISLSLPSNTMLLLLQAFLWLFPSLILLCCLALLPSQLWSMLISVFAAISIWLMCNHLIKKYQFGLTVNKL